MDPMTLAASAVSLLAPLLSRLGKTVLDEAGEHADELASSKVGELFRWVAAKLGGDRFGQPALERLADAPENQVRQATVAEALGEMVAGDENLAAELAGLVERA